MSELVITSNDPDGDKTLPVAATPLPFFDSMEVVSKDGTVRLFGVTEMADVSNPPRKYLSSWPNWVATLRYGEPGGPVCFRHGQSDRLLFNAVGTKTGQMSLGQQTGSIVPSPTTVGDGPPPAGTPWSASNNGFSTGGGFQDDSYENLDESSIGGQNWTPYWIAWQREKRRKYYDASNITLAPNEYVDSPGLHWRSQLMGSATNPNARTTLVMAPVWMGTFWRIAGYFAIVGPPIGFGPVFTLRAMIAGGDQFIADGSDFVLVTSAQTGLGSTVHQWWGLDVPPDTSVRFRLDITGEATEYFPEVLGSLAQMQEAGLDPWLYLPSADADVVGPYEERLGAEDTYEDGFARTVFDLGTNPVAVTRSVAGGTTAESQTPLDVDLRLVDLTFNLKNLTAGRTYQAITRIRQNTIGLTDYSFSDEVQQFDAIADTHALPWPQLLAPTGMELQAVRLQLQDLGPTPTPPTPPTELQTETLAWYGRVLAAGGLLEADTLEILNNFVIQAKAQSWWSKLFYFVPLVGADLAAALTPLVGGTRGRATNNNFVEGDYSQSTGLAGNGSSKILDLPFRAGDIAGAANPNGGMGLFALAKGAGEASALGNLTATSWFRLAVNAAGGAIEFQWGLPANTAQGASASVIPGFMYGQRSSATSREVFVNGVSVGTNATNDAAGNSTVRALRWMGIQNNAPAYQYWANAVSGCMVVTNGLLSGPEALSLYETLRDYIEVPTGRI